MNYKKDDTSKTDQVNTGGGASVGGNANADRDFVGRDQRIQGDVVKGNKIVNITTTPPTPSEQSAHLSPRWRRAITINTILTGVFAFLSAILTNVATGVLPESWKPHLWIAWPAAALITGISIWLTLHQSSLEDEATSVPLSVDQHNRQSMLKRVRLDWIDGVLRKSLYQEALLSLGLEERSDAVIRPFDIQMQRPNQEPQPLPAGTKVIEVFDRFGGSLLILGAPGAGKTTMLLELARDLLVRAEHNEKHLIPVVFNLSSWAVKRRSLKEWLVEELNTKYYIPHKVAQRWLNSDQVLPLLDGLDEVATEHRAACVEAINTFCKKGTLVNIVVCSRIVDYEILATKLNLQGATLIQSLTRQQAYAYLMTLGKPLDGVRAALRDDSDLWELIETPLWLNIMTLAYQDISPRKLRWTVTPEERRKEILTAYIRAVFRRRQQERRYNQKQTVEWLSWLAGQMVQHSQIIFSIEYLQPDWLIIRSHSWLYRSIVGLIMGLSVGLITGLEMGLSVGLIVGLGGGLIGGVQNINLTTQLRIDREKLIFGLILGLIFGLGMGLDVGLRAMLIIMLNTGLIFGLSFGLRPRRAPQTVYPNQGIWHSAQNMMIVGLSAGLITGLTMGLSVGLIRGLTMGLSVGLVVGLIAGLGMGFQFGGLACIQHFILRTLLWMNNRTPVNYAKFLDHCIERIFLRRVGGGYIFIHRLVMEYFADLTEEDIRQIVDKVRE